MEVLRTRAEVLAKIRGFFAEREVLEVETPLLGSAPVTDLHLAALSCRYRGPGHDGGRQLWLQTSPEFAMKRLLAAGSGSIYQLGKAFRDGEAGSRHNPEFTILEWYRPGWDHHRLMDEVGELLDVVIFRGSTKDQGRRQQSAAATRTHPGEVTHKSPDGRVPGSNFVRREQSCVPGIPFHRVGNMEKLTYSEAFQRHVGVDPHTVSIAELTARACSLLGHAAPDLGDDRDAWLDLLLSHVIEPELGHGSPTFVFDFPASQAALARVRPGDPPVAERFEVWVEGIELANGYHELTDPAEQRRRFEADLAARRDRSLPEVPVDRRLLAALEHGLPDCAGVALGVDRLVMLAAGAERIDEVISFPIDRA
jgi:lysyl-tRNA synthetase class 2